MTQVMVGVLTAGLRDGGFVAQAQTPFEVFDQWIEVLPTDQVVPVEVTYRSQDWNADLTMAAIAASPQALSLPPKLRRLSHCSPMFRLPHLQVPACS